MKLIPLPHQQRIVDLNPSKCLLNWEMRVGKQLPGSLWVDHPCRAGNTYIICIKKNKQSWINMNTKATVLTKEEFKRDIATIICPTAIVVDEIHKFGSPLFVKGRSQLAVALYKLIKANPDCHILGLSATMIKQDAWSLHTILCYVGVYYDWKKWREEFFELRMMPFLRFPAWFPRANWRENMKKYEQKHTDIVSLKDVIENLPPAQTKVIKTKTSKYVRPVDEIVTWVDEHRHEQEGKLAEILELGYKKVILVCKYTSQIDFLAEKLKSEKPVYILDGRTKNAEETTKQAQDAEECYFIVQSECGESWDGWQFSVMVFVSMGHSVVSHTQMLGRQRHSKHLRVTETLYYIGGAWDKRIYDCIMEGYNFSPHKYVTQLTSNQ